MSHSRRALLALLALVAAALVSAAGTGTASAHASLVATLPADGQSVAEAPAQVTATFTEGVSVDVGGLEVRDGDGTRVDDGETTVDASGTTIAVALRDGLDDGTYVATYRVLSADGHPVSGSFVFGIGAGPVDFGAVSGTTGDDTTWEAAGAVARFVTYLSALLAAGMAFFLAFVHDQRGDRWKLVPIVRLATIAGLLGVVLTVAAQAALLTGDGLAAATDGEVLREVLSDRLGWSAVVLLLGLAAVHLSTDTERLLVAQALAFYGGLATVVSFALWGHATEAPYRWLALGADVVHVGAAALWFGGLVGLAVVLRRRAPQPVASTALIVGRFSTLAAASVVALVAAGLALTWVESGGSPRAVWSTTYGRLVLLKVAVTGVVLAMAWFNRYRLVPALTADEGTTGTADGTGTSGGVGDDGDGRDDLGARGVADHDEDTAPVASSVAAPRGTTTDVAAEAPTDDERAWRWAELRRTVRHEALALVAVLGVTAVLVNVTPARDSVTSGARVVELSEAVDTGTVDVVVTPAVVGTNTFHIQYADPAGRPLDVANTLALELSLPDQQLGPITRQVVKAGPGHFVLEGRELSLPGTWTVTLAVRTGDFSEQRSTFQVEVAR